MATKNNTITYIYRAHIQSSEHDIVDISGSVTSYRMISGQQIHFRLGNWEYGYSNSEHWPQVVFVVNLLRSVRTDTISGLG